MRFTCGRVRKLGRFAPGLPALPPPLLPPLLPPPLLLCTAAAMECSLVETIAALPDNSCAVAPTAGGAALLLGLLLLSRTAGDAGATAAPLNVSCSVDLLGLMSPCAADFLGLLDLLLLVCCCKAVPVLVPLFLTAPLLLLLLCVASKARTHCRTSSEPPCFCCCCCWKGLPGCSMLLWSLLLSVASPSQPTGAISNLMLLGGFRGAFCRLLLLLLLPTGPGAATPLTAP
jgi:hypothetical protein